MTDDPYKIHKRREPVTLWVHPEGPVKGYLYLQQTSDRGDRPEHPVEILNLDAPFIVVQCEDPDETRFYGKRAIVRVHHDPIEGEDDTSSLTMLPCELRMMDGSSLRGTIREFLPPEHRRLFDYLNQRGESFLRLHLDDGGICLVNKAYIVRAMETGDDA